VARIDLKNVVSGQIVSLLNLIVNIQSKQQESSVMDNLNKQQPTVQQKKKLRSKGDRLGWTPLNKVEHKPLSEVLGKPRILTDENMYRLKGVKPIL